MIEMFLFGAVVLREVQADTSEILSLDTIGKYVAVGTDSGKVYKYDFSSDPFSPDWVYPSSGTIGGVNSVTFETQSDGDDDVFCGTNGTDVYFLDDSNSGNPDWTGSDPAESVAATCEVYDGSSYYYAAGSCDNYVYLYTATGSLSWSYNAGNDVHFLCTIGNHLLALTEKDFPVQGGVYLFTTSALTGSKSFSGCYPTFACSSTDGLAAGEDGRFLVGFSDGYVRLYSYTVEATSISISDPIYYSDIGSSIKFLFDLGDVENYGTINPGNEWLAVDSSGVVYLISHDNVSAPDLEVKISSTYTLGSNLPNPVWDACMIDDIDGDGVKDLVVACGSTGDSYIYFISGKTLELLWKYKVDEAKYGVAKLVEPIDDLDTTDNGGSQDVVFSTFDGYIVALRSSTQPQLKLSGLPSEYTDGVEPNEGLEGDTFTFKVIYTDREGDPPVTAQVWVDLDDDGARESDERFSMDVDTSASADLQDGDYTNGEAYTVDVTVSNVSGDGVLSFDFEFEDENGTALWTSQVELSVRIYSRKPKLEWAGTEGYTGDGVEPDVAPAGTTFTFKVKYVDYDSDSPNYAKIWIDLDDDGTLESGEIFDMTEESSGANTPFGIWKIYSFSKEMDYAGDGVLKYAFYFNDSDLTPPPTDADGQPTINSYSSSQYWAGGIGYIPHTFVIASVPFLTWVGDSGYESDGVAPDEVVTGNTVTFRVKYIDYDNDAPAIKQLWIDMDDDGSYSSDEKFTMEDEDYSDYTYSDGKVYRLEKTLYFAGDGKLHYKFVFSDPDGDAIGEATAEQIIEVRERERTLSNILVGPNPYVASQSKTGVVFWGLPKGKIIVEIYTISGRLVKRLVKEGDEDSIVWDLKGESGQEVPGGVYIIVLKDEAGNTETRKQIILR